MYVRVCICALVPDERLLLLFLCFFFFFFFPFFSSSSHLSLALIGKVGSFRLLEGQQDWSLPIKSCRYHETA